MNARAALTLCLSLAPLLAASCTCKPTLLEVRNRGFETPIQTLQTFRVALCADWPQEEYNCFSSVFKANNGLSRLGYLEFRQRLLQEQPLLRWALGRATKDPAGYRVQVSGGGRLARIQVDVAGRELNVFLRRESFYEIYGTAEDPLEPPQLWQDDLVDDLIASQQLYEDPEQQATGRDHAPPRSALRRVGLSANGP